MQVRVTEVTEDEVHGVSEMLEKEGFTYDVDFTTLYGEQGAVVGLQFMTPAAAVLGVRALTSIEA